MKSTNTDSNKVSHSTRYIFFNLFIVLHFFWQMFSLNIKRNKFNLKFSSFSIHPFSSKKQRNVIFRQMFQLINASKYIYRTFISSSVTVVTERYLFKVRRNSRGSQFQFSFPALRKECGQKTAYAAKLAPARPAT